MSFQIPPNTTASGANTTNTGGIAFGFNNISNANTNVIGQASPPTGIAFGTIGTSKTGNAPLSFGASNSNATTTTMPTLATTATGALPLNITTATTVTPTFGLGSATGLGGALNFGSASTTITSSSSGFSFGQMTAANTNVSSNTGFSFGAPTLAITTVGEAAITTSTTTAPILSAALATPSVPPATTSAIGIDGGFTSLSTSTKTTDSSAINPTTQLTYNQLEEHINKWTLELEEHEKVFIDQATQINAWDRILFGNNQQMFDLSEAVKKVKNDQRHLEQELEFISTQHKEVEECILPLKEEFMKMPPVDLERSQTYLKAENLDTQLKQMAEDLKELIDNLNENSKFQDTTDPVIQIGKILNAHMNSLQWVERSTNTIAIKLDEITKMHQKCKRDAELSFRAAYYN